MPLRPSARSAFRSPPVASGFTLVEIIMVVLLVGILAALALPRLLNSAADARASAIQALGGSVRSSMTLVQGQIAVHGAGTAGQQGGITWITLADSTPVRIWNGYPDRWCDGIGVMQQTLQVPQGGCYLSSSPVMQDQFTFYGYGNSQIPNGDAGWRIESAANPQLCSVEYHYNGSGAPVVTVSTSGC